MPLRRTESLKFRAVSSATDLVPGTAAGAGREGKSTGRSRGSSVVRRAIHRILDKPTQLLATDYGSCYPPCVAEEGMPSIVGRIFSIVPCNSKFFHLYSYSALSSLRCFVYFNLKRKMSFFLQTRHRCVSLPNTSVNKTYGICSIVCRCRRKESKSLWKRVRVFDARNEI